MVCKPASFSTSLQPSQLQGRRWEEGERGKGGGGGGGCDMDKGGKRITFGALL